MKYISFAWTTPALLAGRKTVTRRDWNDRYARTFQPGELVQAYDKLPRNGGKPIALLRIVSVTKERDADTPDIDWEAEGFAWFDEQERARAARGKASTAIARRVSWPGFVRWRQNAGDAMSWVVRFELVEILAKAGVPA